MPLATQLPMSVMVPFCHRNAWDVPLDSDIPLDPTTWPSLLMSFAMLVYPPRVPRSVATICAEEGEAIANRAAIPIIRTTAKHRTDRIPNSLLHKLKLTCV